jgi:hypothetical protein
MRLPIRLLLTALAVTLAAPASAHAAFSFARTDVPLSAGPSSLAVADLDGKNGPDVVATLYTQSKIAVLLNKGDGTFAAPSYIAGCTGAYGTKIGDVTTSGPDLAQDGKLDVVTTCASRKVARMAGDGAGGFGAPVETPNPMTPGTLLLYNDPIELANVRLGGGPPLLLVQADAANFKKILCASYDWATLECLAPPNYPTAGGAMTSGRLNGTARDQIIVGGGTKGTVAFGIADNLPNGPGSVWSATERDSGLPNPSTGGGFRRVTDVNGDGQLDIIASQGDSFSGSFGVQLWGPGGILDVPAVVHASAVGLGPVVVGDFSGDGHPDVLGVTGYGRVLAHAGDGAGGFDAGTDVPLIGFQNPAYASTVTAELIDADCDGRPDAVIADNASASIEVLRNTQSPGTARCTGAPVAAPPPPATPVIPAPKPIVLPLTGLRGLPTSLTPGAALTIGLGTASNPPTSIVDLALATIPAGAARSAAKKQAKPKAIRLGTAHIVIPPGRTKKLTLKLNAKARALLKRGNVKTRLTIVATGTDGTRATTVRKLTLKRRAVKRRR